MFVLLPIVARCANKRKVIQKGLSQKPSRIAIIRARQRVALIF